MATSLQPYKTELLQILESNSVENKFSQEDLDSFNERITLFEADGSKGYSVEESQKNKF